jgi:hypothetical protein
MALRFMVRHFGVFAEEPVTHRVDNEIGKGRKQSYS